MSTRTPAVMAPLLAQVNLLPPEVRAARGLARIKMWLGVAVLVAVVMAAGSVALATLDQQSADDKLADVEADTARLQGDLAEYAHVPVVMAALDRETTVRGYGMSTEVLWRPYFDAIAATAPPGVRIENMKVAGATPLSQTAAVLDPLAATGAATVEFTAQAATVADIETWMDGLALVPGFSVPWYTEAMLGAPQEVPMYMVNAGVTVSLDAYSLRFDPTRLAEAAAAAAADADADATDDAAEGDD